jgi:hypothetical protein
MLVCPFVTKCGDSGGFAYCKEGILMFGNYGQLNLKCRAWVEPRTKILGKYKMEDIEIEPGYCRLINKEACGCK